MMGWRESKVVLLNFQMAMMSSRLLHRRGRRISLFELWVLMCRRKAPAAKAPATKKAPAKNLKQTQINFGSSQVGGRRK